MGRYHVDRARTDDPGTITITSIAIAIQVHTINDLTRRCHACDEFETITQEHAPTTMIVLQCLLGKYSKTIAKTQVILLQAQMPRIKEVEQMEETTRHMGVAASQIQPHIQADPRIQAYI